MTQLTNRRALGNVAGQGDSSAGIETPYFVGVHTPKKRVFSCFSYGRGVWSHLRVGRSLRIGSLNSVRSCRQKIETFSDGLNPFVGGAIMAHNDNVRASSAKQASTRPPATTTWLVDLNQLSNLINDGVRVKHPFPTRSVSLRYPSYKGLVGGKDVA